MKKNHHKFYMAFIVVTVHLLLASAGSYADNIYVSCFGSGKITKFCSGGKSSTFASGMDGPEGLAFDSSGSLYVTCFYLEESRYLGEVRRFDSSGNGSVFASGLIGHPSGLAFDSSGYLYVTNELGGTIEKFDSSGNSSIFASGLNYPWGLEFDSSGYLYVANNGDSSVVKIDPRGNKSVFASSGVSGPEGIAIQVPDPSTLLLLGLGGLLLRKRRA